MSMWSFVVFYICVYGVFGVDTDEVKSVSVMEGDSVTLHTDVTEVQRDDQIIWRFGPENARIAEIYKLNSPKYDRIERFRDNLVLDRRTGSLTIRNINKSATQGHHTRDLTITVYTPVTTATVSRSSLLREGETSGNMNDFSTGQSQTASRLPIPVIIIRDSSQCSSSSECVLVCSVVTHVTLSWYKGNSLLSSISVSDLNSSLSLPLEVEYQENNIYSCVVSNSFTNLTKHLNISEDCQTCSEFHCCSATEAVVRLVISALVGVAALALVVYEFKFREAGEESAAITAHLMALLLKNSEFTV
ncbi:uncharacterized protein LOC127641010 [Xyrauchen texanus]|uniref:uncharacterized protein LOC127641010 n=1 Tax=Xyrauchen texanus TaxID=154827 RepID=UPI0022420529|nr:uncharacterized protein LOC127641010 [Xyrauchen texanus]